jgi:hypothetical protein
MIFVKLEIMGDVQNHQIATWRSDLIKDGNGKLLVEPDQIAARWREYFGALLNDAEEQHQPPNPYQPPAN